MVDEYLNFPDATITSLEGLQSFFEDELEKIDTLEGDKLLARIFGVILYFNSLPEKRKAGLFDKMVEYLRKLKGKLDKIAKVWGVSNYSIGVSAPWGVNISLTFTPISEEIKKRTEIRETIRKSSKERKLPENKMKVT
jgi:hypothetical protein